MPSAKVPVWEEDGKKTVLEFPGEWTDQQIGDAYDEMVQNGAIKPRAEFAGKQPGQVAETTAPGIESFATPRQGGVARQGAPQPSVSIPSVTTPSPQKAPPPPDTPGPTANEDTYRKVLEQSPSGQEVLRQMAARRDLKAAADRFGDWASGLTGAIAGNEEAWREKRQERLNRLVRQARISDINESQAKAAGPGEFLGEVLPPVLDPLNVRGAYQQFGQGASGLAQYAQEQATATPTREVLGVQVPDNPLWQAAATVGNYGETQRNAAQALNDALGKGGRLLPQAFTQVPGSPGYGLPDLPESIAKPAGLVGEVVGRGVGQFAGAVTDPTMLKLAIAGALTQGTAIAPHIAAAASGWFGAEGLTDASSALKEYLELKAQGVDIPEEKTVELWGRMFGGGVMGLLSAKHAYDANRAAGRGLYVDEKGQPVQSPTEAAGLGATQAAELQSRLAAARGEQPPTLAVANPERGETLENMGALEPAPKGPAPPGPRAAALIEATRAAEAERAAQEREALGWRIPALPESRMPGSLEPAGRGGPPPPVSPGPVPAPIEPAPGPVSPPSGAAALPPVAPTTQEPPAAPVASGADERVAERRQTPKEVAEERRVAERRTQLAAEINLPEDHPAVQKVLDAEKAAEIDPGTGLRSAVAYEREKAAHTGPVAVTDLAGLGYVNDKLPGGHELGNAVIKAYGDALGSEPNLVVYRTGGDETTVHWVGDPADTSGFNAAMDRVQTRFADAEWGCTVNGEAVAYKGGRLDYGIGRNRPAADADLYARRKAAVEAGLRPAQKGARPPGLLEVTRPRDVNPLPLPGRDGVASVPAVEGAAPETKPELVAAQGATLSPAPTAGNVNKVKTTGNLSAKTQFEVREASEVQPSHNESEQGLAPNERFDPALQGRTVATDSELRVNRLANNLDPEKLGLGERTSLDAQGAPIIGPDGQVEAGNHRFMAIRRAYRRGLETAARYKQALLADAEGMGLDPKVIEGMKEPVLVRKRTTEVPDRKEWAAQLNEAEAARHFAADQAKADARFLTPEVVRLYQPGADGDLSSLQNAEFVRAFLAAIPEAERGAFQEEITGKDGKKTTVVSKIGLARMENALFHHIFQDDALLRGVVAGGAGSVNIQRGLMAAAPDLLKTKNDVAAGRVHNVDLLAPIVEAAHLFAKARGEGWDINNLIGQGTIEGTGVEIPEATKEVLRVFDEKARSGGAIGRFIRTAARVLREKGDPRQEDMFGGAAPPPTAAEVFAEARDRFNTEEAGGQPRLVSKVPEPSETRGVTPTHERPLDDMLGEVRSRLAPMPDGDKTQAEFEQRLARLNDKQKAALARVTLEALKGDEGGPQYSRRAALVRAADDIVDITRQGVERGWHKWYEKHAEFVKTMFGEDAELFSRFLAATSANTNLAVNVTLALKAYRQFINGEEFRGYRGTHIDQLNRVLGGDELTGLKVSRFDRAMHGDQNAVPIDSWMARLLFNTDKPTEAQHRRGWAMMEEVAAKLGITPREAMAAAWSYYREEKGNVKTHGRDYEELLRKRTDEIAALAGAGAYGRSSGLPLEARIEGSRRAAQAQRREESRFFSRREAAREALDTSSRRLSPDEAQGIVDRWNRRYGNVSPATLHETQADLPGGLNPGAGYLVDGVRQGNEVHIVAENIRDRAHLLDTLIHETLGHAGPRAILDRATAGELWDSVWRAKGDEIRSAPWLRDYQDVIEKAGGIDSRGGQRVAADEWLARETANVLRAEEGAREAKEAKRPEFVNKFLALLYKAVNSLAETFGVKKRYSAADVYDLVKNGKWGAEDVRTLAEAAKGGVATEGGGWQASRTTAKPATLEVWDTRANEWRKWGTYPSKAQARQREVFARTEGYDTRIEEGDTASKAFEYPDEREWRQGNRRQFARTARTPEEWAKFFDSAAENIQREDADRIAREAKLGTRPPTAEELRPDVPGERDSASGDPESRPAPTDPDLLSQEPVNAMAAPGEAAAAAPRTTKSPPPMPTAEEQWRSKELTRGIIRERAAQKDRRLVQWETHMREWSKQLDRPSKAVDPIVAQTQGAIENLAANEPDPKRKKQLTKLAKNVGKFAGQIEFIDRMEKRQAQRTPELQAVADYLRQTLDARRDMIRRWGKLQQFNENYFPHIWTDPERAAQTYGQFFSSRRLEGAKEWQKHRSLEDMLAGLEKGLTPISFNPIDLVLTKLTSMEKFITANQILDEMHSLGIPKFVRTGADLPEGYRFVDDPALAVYGPPHITVEEAFDAQVMEGLSGLARKLGINVETKLKLGKGVWGTAQGEGTVKRKFAGPESVLTHEIGHILENRYHIFDALVNPSVKQANLFGEPDTIIKDRQTTINRELADLADLRGHRDTAYTHSADEKIANLVHAYVHTPDLMRAFAPTTLRAFDSFLDKHPELRALRQIKPSLELGAREQEIPIGGFPKYGQYALPEGAAGLINNFISHSSLGDIPAFAKWRTAQNLMLSARLGWSGFHLMFTSLDAATSKMSLGLERVLSGTHGLLYGREGSLTRIGSGLVDIGMGATIAPALYENIQRGRKMMERWEGRGGAPGRDSIEMDAVNEALEAGGYHARMAQQHVIGGYDGFWKALRQRDTEGLLKSAIPGAIETGTRFILNTIVPLQKAGIAADLARFELEKLQQREGTTSLQQTVRRVDRHELRQIMAKTEESVVNRMGQVAYDNLFWNRTLKDIAFTSIQSVGWNLGTYRELFGGAADIRRIISPEKSVVKGGAPLSRFTHRLSYDVALLAGTMMWGALLQKLATGKNPDGLKDYVFPRTGRLNPDGTEERLAIPTYIKDLFGYFGGFQRGISHGLSQAATTLQHKLHPSWSMLAEFLRNQDFYGTQIFHPVERGTPDELVQWGKDLGHFLAGGVAPYALKGYQQRAKTGVGFAGKALPFIGITPASSVITRSPGRQELLDIMRKRGEGMTKTQEAADRNQTLRQLELSIRRGEGLPADLDRSNLRPGDIDKLFAKVGKNASIPVEQFKRLNAEEALRVFDLMYDSEPAALLAQLRPLAVKKYYDALDKRSPDEAKRLKAQWAHIIEKEKARRETASHR